MHYSLSHKPGDLIGGRYRVQFGALRGFAEEEYLCLDEQSTTPFILRTLRSPFMLPQIVHGLTAEVGQWVSLEGHPNIVRCHRVEMFNGRPFLLLECLTAREGEGFSLRDWLQRGPIDQKLALKFGIDMTRGLTHANEKVPGIVHGNLKPENVYINQNHLAKIADFGFVGGIGRAQALLNPSSIRTGIGDNAGAVDYRSPEQLRGEPLDVRSDIYTLGRILSELLPGKPSNATSTPTAPNVTLAAGISINEVIAHCTAPGREQRYQDMASLLTDLERVYGVLFHEQPPVVLSGDTLAAIDLKNQAAILLSLGRREQALVCLSEAIRLNRADVQSYIQRGEMLYDLGRHQKALADYNRAVQVDPKSADAYFHRGHLLQVLGQHKQARYDLTRATQLAPTWPSVFITSGILYMQMGELEKALADFNHASAFGCDDGAVLAAQVRQEMKNSSSSYGSVRNNPMAAFDVFMQADSLEAMQQAVKGFPIMTNPQFVREVEKVIRGERSSWGTRNVQQQVALLKQIVSRVH